MNGRDKSGNEILMEQLEKRVVHLASEQKAKEMAIKELNDRLWSIERDSAAMLRKAELERDEQIAKLKKEVEPYRDAKHVAEQLQREIAALRQDKLHAVSEIKAAKGLVLQETNLAIEKATVRLAKIEQAIAQQKATVASV